MCAIGLASLVSACFTDGPMETIEVAPETIVVVQGVVRADQTQQWLLLERTFNGTGFGQTDSPLPGTRVAVPVEGADVTIENVSYPADPCGPIVRLVEGIGPEDRRQPGAYWSPHGCPTLRPGDTLDLLVVDGEDLVTGRTIVPGTSAVVLDAGGVTVQVPGSVLDFNRDTDTLRVAVDPIGGRMLVVEVRERRFVEPLSYLARVRAHAQIWVDDTELTLPGDLPDAFGNDPDLDRLTDVFTAGRMHVVTVAYADENFYDQIRSNNTPVTGRGYINSIDGGLGYFASMAVTRADIRVVGEIDDPREGTYRMEGVVEAVPVSLDWEMYLNRATEDGTGHSAFVVGDWVLGAYDAWTAGTVSDNELASFIAQPTGETTPEGELELRVWEIKGLLDASGGSTLRVLIDGIQVGTLTATKR